MRRALVLAITLVTGHAANAHVAPSVDDNNRYLKLTPQADRVRLAYTVFFGEVPGGQMRPSLDTNRDGTISDGEADIFGSKLAGDVAGMLDVSIDHTQIPIAWAEIVVGLGAPTVKGGAFSVDLVAYVCLPSIGGRHTLLLRDRFRVPRPGETEVRIEDSPGIVFQTARVGPADDPSHIYKFVGPGGPISDDGIEIVFDAGDKARIGGGCPTGDTSGGPPWLWIGGAAIVLGLGAFLVLRRRPRD